MQAFTFRAAATHMVRPVAGLAAGAFVAAAAVAMSGGQARAALEPAGPDPAAFDTSGSFIVHELVTRHAFEADGSGVRSLRVRVAVNDRAGVAQWGVVSVPYLASLEQVELKELTVVKPDGRRVTAGEAPAEDVRLTGRFDEPVFTDLRAMRVVVPSLQPGDRLEYEFAVRASASLIPGHFWADHSFFRAAVVVKEVYEIEAPESRLLKVVARRGVESAPERLAGGRILRRWTHVQPTPDAELLDPQRQQKAILREAKLGPDVRLSSFETWEELGRSIAAIMAEKARPGDAVRERAREITNGLTSDDERLQALFRHVSEHVRYVSLAFGIGRLEPRPAEVVLTTQFGDCKDKHVLLASLAQAAGIEIAPVLVSSMTELDDRVPSPSQFDHVVSVRRRGADPSDWLWLDSTTGVLPPGALLAPFRGQRGLLATRGSAAVVAEAVPGLVATPAELPSPSRTAVDIKGVFADDGRFTADVSRRLEGDDEFVLRLALRAMDQKQRELAARQLASSDGMDEVDVDEVRFEDTGPGRGIEVSYRATRVYGLGDGEPWRFWPIAPSLDLEKVESGSTDLLELTLPSETLFTGRYEMPAPFPGPPPVPVTLDRAYASYRSAYRIEERTLFVERQLRILARTVQPEQLSDYEAFRRAVDADYRQYASAGAVKRASSEGGSEADALNRTGVEAFDRRDHKEAIRLLRLATEADPKHGSAWTNLGRAYRANGEPALAIKALSRQIANNPYDQYAYTHLGHANWDLKRHDEAIALFRKQLEINPLDSWTHSSLGAIYLSLGRHGEAAESAERAVSADPNDTYSWQTLARARLELGRAHAALAAYREFIRLAPSAASRNHVAYMFAARGLHLDEAERLVREAIDEVAKEMNASSLDTAVAATLKIADDLATYWDTLGWVYFQRSDYAAALRFLEASWALMPDPEVAEHLAMTHERVKHNDRALALYAIGAHGGRSESLAALERLAGREAADRLIAAAPVEIASNRVIPLKGRVSGGEADVYLVIDEIGQVRATRFVGGDEKVRPLVDRLLPLRLRFKAPDERTVKFIRRAVVRCGTDGYCALFVGHGLGKEPDGGERKAK